MKIKPNIPKVPFNDRGRIKNLIREVIEDTLIFEFIPDIVDLTDGLFTLILQNKKFQFEELQVDNTSDYIDVYLQGIKKTFETYNVTTTDTDIVITFNQNITLRPDEIVGDDFLIKGKIVEI